MKKRMIQGCMSSVGRLCIIQKQDSPEPGAFARMNFPGTLSTADWTRRTAPGMITDALADRICEITRRYGRL